MHQEFIMNLRKAHHKSPIIPPQVHYVKGHLIIFNTKKGHSDELVRRRTFKAPRLGPLTPRGDEWISLESGFQNIKKHKKTLYKKIGDSDELVRRWTFKTPRFGHL